MTETYTLRQRIFIKYWYLNMFFGRANGYVSEILNVIQFYVLMMVYIKLIIVDYNPVLVNIIFVFGFGIFMTIGYLDVKFRINREQTSFSNQFNPEIMHLIKAAGGKVKK